MNKMFSVLIFLICFSLCVAFSSCGTTEQVTGTEIGNPSTVSGRVYDNQGITVANAAVFLVTPDYNPVLDSIPPIDFLHNSQEVKRPISRASDKKRVLTYTNTRGEFILSNIEPRSYNLFITDSAARRIGFWPRIMINEKTVDLGLCRIKQTGYATVAIPDSVFSSKGYISFPGTPLKMEITASGRYTIPVINDSVNINYYSSFGDSVAAVIHNGFIPDVNPGDTIDLTDLNPIIFLPVLVENPGMNFSFSGTDTEYVRVTASGAMIYKNGFLEIEYQFYESTEKKLTHWDADSNYQLKITGDEEYVVSCRIRGKSDTSVVSDWAPDLLIIARPRIVFPGWAASD